MQEINRLRLPLTISPPQDALTVLLHLFQQQPSFVNRGRVVKNKKTAWDEWLSFGLHNDTAAERLSIEEIGSSVDKISVLRLLQQLIKRSQ